MKAGLTLIAFVALVLGGGLAIGYATAPGPWYAGLAKPAFTPPGWVFPIAWSAIYVLIAVTGWRLWRRDRAGWPMRLWGAQLALNFLWSPVFFAAHRMGLALAVIVLLLAVIVAFIETCWSRDRTSALLFTPYALWVAFATVLNAGFLALN